jgi:hypothetical protein
VTKIDDPTMPAEAPEEDTRAAHAVPSLMANRFHLTAGEAMMRITFGEQVIPETPVAYHQAVMLPRSEALLLAQMIQRMFGAQPPLPRAPDAAAHH